VQNSHPILPTRNHVDAGFTNRKETILLKMAYHH